MTDASTPVVVAIDGPAGSGKSSVSKQAARRLGYGFLDTGAAYRALAWHAEASGVETDDAPSVVSCLSSFEYRIGTDPTGYAVHVGDVDVTTAIRDPEISAVVSRVARVPEVRRHLIELLCHEPRSISSLARELGMTRGDVEEDLRHALR